MAGKSGDALMIATSYEPNDPVNSLPVIAQIRPIAENRVLLHQVNWETFEQLILDIGDRRSTLFHYINGTLEIMSPLSLHEGNSRFFDKLEYVQKRLTLGESATLREFRKWIRDNT